MKRPSCFSFLVVALLLASAHISVLSKFVCTHEPIDGQFYEYHNPWQLCSAFDNAVAQPVYALSITFYTIGIPLLFAAIAVKFRMLRAANEDAGCMYLRSLFGSIMQSYREEYHWWEVVAIGRRFLICACAALLSPRVDALTLSIFIILSVSLVLRHAPHPSSSPSTTPSKPPTSPWSCSATWPASCSAQTS